MEADACPAHGGLRSRFPNRKREFATRPLRSNDQTILLTIPSSRSSAGARRDGQPLGVGLQKADEIENLSGVIARVRESARSALVDRLASPRDAGNVGLRRRERRPFQ